MPRTLSAAVVLLVGPLASAADPPVTAAAVRPDGHQVAFAVGGAVRLYGTGGEAGAVIPAPDGRVTALAYAPEKNAVASGGKWLAVAAGEAGKSGVVRVYELPWPQHLPVAAPVATFDGHKDAVYAVAWSPDGRTLATAGYDRVVHLWEFTGKPPEPKTEVVPKRTLKDHSDAVYGLAFSPDGTLLASASADRAVKVWDVATGQRLYTLGESTDWVYAVAWSPDGRHLAAGGVDKSVRVWAADRAGGRLVHAVFAHEGPVWRLAYARDGKRLFSVGEDRVVKAWDAAKMVEAKVYPKHPDAVLDFALAPGAEWFAVARFDGVGRLVDAATGELRPKNGLPPLPKVPPKPAKVTPAAVTRAQHQPVTVTGTDLEHVTAVTADRPGVRAQLAGPPTRTEARLEVTVEPTVPAGVVKLTLENAVGKAAPVTLIVDRQTAVPEAGVTDSARAAMTVTPNVTVAGAVDRAGDVDFFRFKADRGYQLGAQVVAAEVGSKLDPVLVVADAGGTVLAEGGATLGFVVPAAGFYSVGVRDKEYRGGADFTYRLHLGDVPVVTGVFPLGVQRGKTTTVHVTGVNLSAGQGAVSVAVPADAAPGAKVPVPLPATGEPPLGSPAVVVDEFPSAVVPPAGGEVRVPGSADGILAKPGDAQTVKFPARVGQRLVVEVNARRLGSPVDPVIEILDAAGKPVPRATLRATAKVFSTFRDHDSNAPGIRLEAWSELAIDDLLYADGELMRVLALPKNPDDDCQFYQVGGQRVGFLGTTPAHHAMGCPMYRVEVHPPGRTFPPNGLPTFTLSYRNDDGGPGYGKDARLFFDPPADGTYQVRVTDARAAGGPTHAYRVTVRPPRPDFAVSFNPTTPTVWKGGAVPVGVTVTRLDGFDGPVTVRLGGLPSGFQSAPTVVEGNLTTGSLALFAEPGATVPPNAKLTLVGTATVDGKELRREAAGGPPKLSDPGDVVTTTRQQAVTLRPGHETRLVVDVERRGDFKGRIPVEVRGLPHGVRVLNIGLNGILVTERDTSREVVLYAEPWVEPREVPVVVVARSERKGTEHAARAVLLKIAK